DAGALALAAGVDVGISFESGYMFDMLASVREGKVPMSLIDRSVRRILKQKFRLGLFEKALVDQERAVEIVHQAEHQDIALRAARDKAPTDGEGYAAATLGLTGLQEELVKAVQGTGTPAVVVLINGRPLAVRRIAQHVPAILEAWLPGERGGQAVAEALFGEI